MTPLWASANGITSSILVAGAGDPLSHVLPHELVDKDVFGFAFTNHMFMLLVSMVLLMIIIPIAASKKGIVPKGFRNFLEALMQFIREQVVRPALGSATDQFIPYLWTFFFTILMANLLGMIPLGAIVMGAGGLDATLAHWGGTATGNLGVTAGLAICGFFLIHFGGMAKQGAGGYWKNYFFGHAPIALAPLMIPLEIVAGLVKPFALAVRLFANMTAGHIVLAVLLGFAITAATNGGLQYGITVAAVLGSVAFSLLELFVAFLQAYIFTFLLTLFIGAAIHHH
ncbi:MAG: F0F1 ATP synthase subunit A [Planctomycetota bacterium]|nr:F0F1 ATP synthase subunit A [Planctomycetota bacterium]